ncbi:MAG: hypothetical protein ACYC0V_16080 [Armatimonadota bacterium]
MLDPLNDIRICELPDMRVLVSLIYDENGKPIDDMADGMNKWADARGIHARLGLREELAYFDMLHGIFVFYLQIPGDFVNDGPYSDVILKGGFVAIVSGERDHLVLRYNELMEWLGTNDRYEVDMIDGKQRHDALVDWLTPWEINKRFDFEQQDIIIPIRLRQ